MIVFPLKTSNETVFALHREHPLDCRKTWSKIGWFFRLRVFSLNMPLSAVSAILVWQPLGLKSAKEDEQWSSKVVFIYDDINFLISELKRSLLPECTNPLPSLPSKIVWGSEKRRDLRVVKKLVDKSKIYVIKLRDIWTLLKKTVVFFFSSCGVLLQFLLCIRRAKLLK